MGYPYIKKSGQAESGQAKSWLRNSEWETLPTITDTDEKIAILWAVFDNSSNDVRFEIEGNYNVDWGDGLSENVSSGVPAEHNFDYDNPMLDGTLTADGYKQSIIVITPQSGASITDIDLAKPHSTIGNDARNSGMLEFVASLPNLNDILLYQSYIHHSMCESFSLMSAGGVLPAYRLFYKFSSLENVEFGPGVTFSNVDSMYGYCTKLQYAPVISFSGSSLGDHFYYCYSLQEAPVYNTSAVTDFSSMFANCYQLKKVQSIDTSSALNVSSMYSNCYSIRNLPAMDFSDVTNCTSCFTSCYSLVRGPDLVMPTTAVSLSSFFNGCYSLSSIPDYDLSGVTSFLDLLLNFQLLT